jgi:hypothetical protein
LIHHVNALEAREHVRRWREAGNRGVQRTALTRAGEERPGGYGRSPCATTRACARSPLIEQTAQLAELLDALEAGLEGDHPT